MEDASRALWLAIGAILFIIAVTITIVMYTNLINTVNTTLSINNIKTNVTEQQGVVGNITYTSAQLYYMLESVKQNYANGKNTELYSDSLLIDGNPIDSTNYESDLNTIIASIGGGPYNVTYTYEYNNSGLNNLNNHKISSIDW